LIPRWLSMFGTPFSFLEHSNSENIVMTNHTTKPYKTNKLIYGLGLNDANYVVKRTVNGKRTTCPFYRKWIAMFKRAYCQDYHKKNPTYTECSIVKEWHSFMNFRAWMMFQDWEDKQLDKDIIRPGNKVYGPNTCVFVTKHINSLLTNMSVENKYTKGACIKKDGNLEVMCSVKGKKQYVGRFSTHEAASKAYREFKSAHIISVANEQTDVRVRYGLLKHARMLMI